MVMDIKHVAIYLRKSRKEDGLTDAEALGNHRERLISLAKGNDWDYKIYQEVASGVSNEREQLASMLKKLYMYDAILVMDIDRLSRDRYTSAAIMKKLKDNNVKIVTADGRITDLNNEQDEIMTGMQEVFANYEYNQIRKRMLRGKHYGAQKGHWVTGRVPLGYFYDKELKHLKINPDESDLVSRIFRSYGFTKKSAEDICIELNSEGRTGKNGKPFAAYSVMTILRNETYLGNTSMMGNVVENTHEPIVDIDTWNKVQSRLSLNKASGNNIAHSLSGIFKCGLCGKTLPIRYNPSGTRAVKGCHRRDILTGELCRNRGVSYQKAFEALMAEVSVYRNNIVEKLSLISIRDSELEDTRERDVTYLENELKKNDVALNRLNRAFMNGDLTDDEFSALKQEKVAERKTLENRLHEAKSRTADDFKGKYTAMLNRLDNLLESFETPSTEKQLNEILKSVIIKIDLFFEPGTKEPRMVLHWRE